MHFTPLLSSFLPSIYNGLNPDSHGVYFHSIDQLPLIVANVIQIILTLTSALAVIFIIVAGIRYITSEGDPGRTTTAKDGLKNAIIGLVLSASAFLIVEFIARQFPS